ncbi:MAG: TatD family hydrolase [Erysipelotrichaceae bacterium]|nr:TatD family hydrolase [Erysipelotrichaceae bacterium]
MLGWLDSHAHICSKEFDEDLDIVINNIKENNITKVMIICSDLNECEKAFDLAKNDKRFDVAVGLHPIDQKDLTKEDYDRFYMYAKNKYVKAIGEIGLDYHWHNDNKEEQKELFIKQIELAKQLDKPIIVHSRDAMQDTFEILKKYKIKGVLHSYSGSYEMAKEFIKLGYYISIAGPVTFKNARILKEVASKIDLDKLLIETDCPYMTPVPYRGKRNEPMYVKHTGKYICELRNIDEIIFQKQIHNNYETLFNSN